MAFAKPVPPIDSIAEEETPVAVVASKGHPPNGPKSINLEDEVEEIVRELNAECTCGTGIKLVRLKQGGNFSVILSNLDVNRRVYA